MISLQQPSLLERLEFSLILLSSNLLSMIADSNEAASLREILSVVDKSKKSATRQTASSSISSAATWTELYTEYFSLDHIPEANWQQQQAINPEMDRPADAHSGVAEAWAFLQRGIETSSRPRQAGRGMNKKALHDEAEVYFSRDAFSFRLCVGLLLRLSNGWSFRDIQKFFVNVKSRAMSSDRCS